MKQKKEYKAWCNSLRCAGVAPGKKVEKPYDKNSCYCKDCGNVLEVRATKSRFEGKKIHRTKDEFDVDVYKVAL